MDNKYLTATYEQNNSSQHNNYCHNAYLNSKGDPIIPLDIKHGTVQPRLANYIEIDRECNNVSNTNNSKHKISNYQIDNEFDLLTGSELKIEIPQIRVKDEYRDTIRVAWCKNLAHSIIKRATFRSGDKSSEIQQVFSQNTLEHYVSTFLNPDKLQEYRELIGNVPELTEFSQELPMYKIIMPQHWFYSLHDSFGLRLFMCNNNNKFSHNYTFDLSFASHLQAQQYNEETEEWDHIPFHNKYIETSSIDKIEFNDPVLIGKYVKLTPDVKEWFQNKESEEYSARNSFYFIDTLEKSRTADLNTTCIFNVSNSTPCVGYSFCAYNTNYQDFNVYFNYTTNINEEIGYSAISNLSLNYQDNRVRTNNIDIFDLKADTWKATRNKLPTGMFLQSFSGILTPHKISASTVTSMTQPEIEIKLANTNPYVQTDQLRDHRAPIVERNEVTEGRYKVNLVMYVLKRLKYENGTIRIEENEQPKQISINSPFHDGKSEISSLY